MIELRDRIKELRRIDVTEIQDNAGNWRSHPLAQRGALHSVLNEVGVVNALLAYESERQGGLTLLDGHLRADEYPGRWPVLVLDLTDDEADIVLATLDPLSAMAGTVPGKLAALVDGIEGVSSDLQATLDEVVRQANDSLVEAADADDADEAGGSMEDEWHVERGEVWAIESASVRGGEHRVMCGSSLDVVDLDTLFAGRRAEMVFTDPPYGIAFDPQEREKLNEEGKRHRFAGGIVGDERGFEQRQWLALVDKYYRGAIYICAGVDMYAELWIWLSTRYGRPPTVIVWIKEMFTFTRRDYHRQHEFLFYGENGGGAALEEGQNEAGGGMVLYTWNARRRWLAGRGETDVWFVRRMNTREYQHPTQKPVALVERAIRNSCQRGGLVADFFGGSGSTLIAAERLGRLAYLMELDPRFVGVILDRARRMGLHPRRVA